MADFLNLVLMLQVVRYIQPIDHTSFVFMHDDLNLGWAKFIFSEKPRLKTSEGRQSI